MMAIAMPAGIRRRKEFPVNSQWIKIRNADGEYEAYLSLPPGGSGPGLLLFQEIFGVNEHIRAVADQYALDGFVVLVPDVFWRDAPRVELDYTGADRDRAMALVTALDKAAAGRDMFSSLAALRARPEVRGKVGAIGYCMGGRFAYLMAAYSDVDAAVAYYGGGIQGQLDVAANIKCPTQFHYGALDKNIPPEAVDSVRQAMAGKDAEIFVYADADHGFNCWARAMYHAPSAAMAHARTLGFLARHLM